MDLENSRIAENSSVCSGRQDAVLYGRQDARRYNRSRICFTAQKLL